MKRLNMKKLHKDQKGITLIELVIVIAITGIITAGITMTIFQVFNMNTRTSNRMTAVSQVQHAGKLVSEDILQAQNVDTESELLIQGVQSCQDRIHKGMRKTEAGLHPAGFGRIRSRLACGTQTCKRR